MDGYDAEPFFAEVAQTAAVAAEAAWTLLANCATPQAPLPPPGGSTYLAPRGLAELAAATWFAGTSATTGREPWQVRPDGMAARIADLWPGPGGSSPRGLVRSGMRWFFVADDPEHGGELWSMPIETVAPTIAATVPTLVRGTLTATVTAADDVTPAPLLALRCRVDTRDWAACGPTYTATGLSTGGHTFTAQAIDQSGNVGTWTATFRSDVTSPAVPTFTAPTATTYLTSPVTYSYRSTDVGSTVANYYLRYCAATPTSGFPSTYSSPSGWSRRTSTSVSVALAPGQEACVSARARDAAGNVSARSADRCTGTPIDDRSLSAGVGPVQPGPFGIAFGVRLLRPAGGVRPAGTRVAGLGA